MRRVLLLLSAPALLLAAPESTATANPDSVADTLKVLAETPAVSGYEEPLAAALKQRLARFSPSRMISGDNLGNVWVKLGSGGRVRLLVACVDEPGYVVSGITEDGYLRVQRLPQRPPHPWFDLLHSAQPVTV